MAKPDKPLLSLGARGTVADTLTFQKRGRGTIARKKPIPKDPKSLAQLAQRQRYKDAVSAWHALSTVLKEAWRGVCPGLTAYQCFMKSELNYVPLPPPIPIDIGDPATDRPSALGVYTLIAKGNPANAGGKITSVQIWANEDLVNCEVAIFTEVSPNTFTTRSNQAIGAVTAGSKQTFPVDLDVEEGDYIGIYYSGGKIDYVSTDGAGMWYIAGADHIPCTEQVFGFSAGVYLSLHGTGEAAA